MGWSMKGATKMAKLLPKVAGAEYDVLSSAEIIRSEKNRNGELGKYTESISHRVSLQNKKIVYFNSHIWGL